MKRSTAVLMLFAFAIGFILFKVKYAVVELEQKVGETLCAIVDEKEHIHMLKAEWSHLTEPRRLEALAEKYLDCAPTQPEQIVALTPSFRESEGFEGPGPHSHLASWKEVR